MNKTVQKLMSLGVWLFWFLLCSNTSAEVSSEKPGRAGSAGIAPESSASETAERPSVDMNFHDVDIRDVIIYVSEVTGTNFIIDPDVKGHVTVEAPTKVPVNDVLRFFLSVLEVYGYTTVDTGGMVKIVPSKEAPRKSIETGPAGQYRPAEDKLVTQTIRLTYLSPDEAKSLLKPLLSESGDIVSHPASGTLIITDFHPNIERQQKIIKALDVPIAQEGGAVAGEAVIVKVIDLDHADAEQLASVLRPLLTTDGRITVYAPTNTLIIRDEKSLVEQLVRVIKGE